MCLHAVSEALDCLPFVRLFYARVCEYDRHSAEGAPLSCQLSPRWPSALRFRLRPRSYEMKRGGIQDNPKTHKIECSGAHNHSIPASPASPSARVVSPPPLPQKALSLLGLLGRCFARCPAPPAPHSHHLTQAAPRPSIQPRSSKPRMSRRPCLVFPTARARVSSRRPLRGVPSHLHYRSVRLTPPSPSPTCAYVGPLNAWRLASTKRASTRQRAKNKSADVCGIHVPSHCMLSHPRG